MFDVANLNLDDLSIDPKDYAEMSKVLRSLADYAKRKGEAMTHRLKGNITSAVNMETACENIYENLPDWAKW